MSKIAVIANVAAGEASAFSQADYPQLADAVWLESDAGGGVVRTALERGCTRIVAAGGDGTVHRVANELLAAGGEAEFAVIPSGTGNDFARGLHVPLDDLEAAVALACEGTARAADVVRVSAESGWERFMINAAYGGMGGPLADEVAQERKERWGALAYWSVAAQRAWDLPEYEATIEVDGARTSLTVHGMLIANGCFIGGGVAIAPDARLDDGKLDAVLVPTQSALQALATAVEVFQARHLESEHTVALRGGRLRWQASPKASFAIDGERGPTDDVTFEVVRGALRVVAQADAVVFEGRPAAPFETP